MLPSTGVALNPPPRNRTENQHDPVERTHIAPVPDTAEPRVVAATSALESGASALALRRRSPESLLFSFPSGPKPETYEHALRNWLSEHSDNFVDEHLQFKIDIDKSWFRAKSDSLLKVCVSVLAHGAPLADPAGLARQSAARAMTRIRRLISPSRRLGSTRHEAHSMNSDDVSTTSPLQSPHRVQSLP
jgi:hypothetical protein